LIVLADGKLVNDVPTPHPKQTNGPRWKRRCTTGPWRFQAEAPYEGIRPRRTRRPQSA
jgi:hypothetical protein